MPPIPTGRRFPPALARRGVTESFKVVDAMDQPLAYVYFEDEPARPLTMKRLTRDEARRIAVHVARLPQLLPSGRDCICLVRTSSLSSPLSTSPFMGKSGQLGETILDPVTVCPNAILSRSCRFCPGAASSLQRGVDTEVISSPVRRA
jgi:hypothetical protein